MEENARDRSRPAGAVLRLAWQSAIYSLGNLGLKVAGLLLLPLYLDPARLTQADYGYLGLLETAAQLAIAITGLGIASGLMRYTAGPSAEINRREFLGTAFVTTVGLALMALGAIFILAEPLARILVGDSGRAEVVRWMGAYVAMKVVGAVPYMVMRVRERAGLFLAALLTEVAILVVGVYLALVVLDAGLTGVMAAFAISAAGAAVPLSIVVLLRVETRWRRDHARKLLRFGAPLAIAALAGILLNAGDRFVLRALAGPEVLAVYVLAAKFGGLINMLFVQSFNMAFAVLGLKAIGASGDTDFHRRVFRHFVVLAGWGVLFVSLLARDLTDAISPNPAYLEAEILILPIAYGFLLYGVYFVVMNVLYAAEKTRQVAGLVLGAAVFNLALNVALIPFLGAMGAALATAAAYGLLAGASVWQARRAMPLSIPWSVLIASTLLLLGLWALAQPTLYWPTAHRLAARLAIIGLYPGLVLLFGIYRRAELLQIVRSFRARLPL